MNKTIIWQEGGDAGAVSVLLVTAQCRRTHAEIPVRYTITGWVPGSSRRPYAAILPACGGDACSSGAVKPCARRVLDSGRHSGQREAAGREHSRTHCHAWHDERAIEFAKAVLSTYGTFIPIDACYR